jgi:hypothetical protein
MMTTDGFYREELLEKERRLPPQHDEKLPKKLG